MKKNVLLIFCLLTAATGFISNANAVLWSTVNSNVVTNNVSNCTNCHGGVNTYTGFLAGFSSPANAASAVNSGYMPKDLPDLDGTRKGYINTWAAQGAPEFAATATTSATVGTKTKTSIVVNGTVDTNVHAATTVAGKYYVQYSTNTSYSSSTTQSTRSSTVSANVARTITGLACGTTYNYRFRASNGHGTSATTTARSAATLACSNPVINVGGFPDNGPLNINVSKGQSLTNADFLISATDTDTTATLDWSRIGALPTAGSVSVTGTNTPNPTITYTAPAAVPVPATVSFTVQVADETPGTTLKDTIVVNVTVIDNAPTVDQGTTYDFVVNEDSTNNVLQLTATDADGDSLTWSTTALPDIAGGAAYTGAVNAADDTKFDIVYSPAPNADTVDADTFTVRVSDPSNGFGEVVVSVDINGSPDDPIANDDPNFEVQVNSGNTALDVLANDINIDTGDTREVTSIVIPPTNSGSATINGIGPGNNILFKPGNNVVVPSTFTYKITDSDGRSDTAVVTVSFFDTDSDGVIDYLDNCAATSNAGQVDVDGDGVPFQTDNTATDPVTTDANGFLVGGNACDEDDDGDGIPDIIEDDPGFPFLNSQVPADAAMDYDGDGLTNLQEYILDNTGASMLVDSVGPMLTAPADVTFNSTGFLTRVDVGKATVTDGNDGAITSLVIGVDVNPATLLDECSELKDFSSRVAPFRPGKYVLTWATCDKAGNFSSAVQNVTVVPLLNTTKAQTTGEGRKVRFEVMLNGPPAAYPVTVDYKVAGRATPAIDHNANGGTITINSPNLTGGITVTVAADMLTEGDEDIILTLSKPVNAVLGATRVHTINITEDNFAPLVALRVTQAGPAGATVYAGGGAVSIIATADDPNGDAVTYDWSMSDSVLTVAAAPIVGNSMNFAVPAAGQYPVAVSVSDGSATTTTTMLLNVVASPDVDDCNLDGVVDGKDVADCDGDGSANAVDGPTDGTSDSDGDGIADYLDSDTYPENILQNQSGDAANSYLLQTEPGLSIGLGATALAAGEAGASVSQEDITNNGGQAGGVGLLPEDDYTNIGGYFDFEITGLNSRSATATVVIPLQSAILADAVYRKYDGSGWFTFVENANNAVMSAQGEPGVCPAPGSSEYTAGLSLFHYCVQLIIQDGGPNDADGVRDNVIRDPGGVGVAPATDPVATAADGRIGVVHPLMLLGMLGIIVLLINRRFSKNTKIL